MDPSTPHAMEWRLMTVNDLHAVHAIAQQVHPAYFEGLEVFTERLRLHPEGCLVLMAVGGGGTVIGYVVSHPWRFGDPPALNTLLEALPAQPNTLYLHDLALLPAARRTGAGGMVVNDLRAHARDLGLARMSLVAVNASAPFWQRLGFEAVTVPGLAKRLAAYDETACFMAAYTALTPPDVEPDTEPG